ncbi:hypothetical protein NDU88_005596 [Pleurodeles waltl]|uniref:Uncharacterized protein n=1 Tax=Pleurodeles waltl TaxID=8319 RepID=A0AAV7NMX8_PLEWA|nr:hypothetical protein NDU88_005596 [Pleurodeles waltl]
MVFQPLTVMTTTGRSRIRWGGPSKPAGPRPLEPSRAGSASEPVRGALQRASSSCGPQIRPRRGLPGRPLSGSPGSQAATPPGANRGAPRPHSSRQHAAPATPGVTLWRPALLTSARRYLRSVTRVRPSPAPRTRRVSGAWFRPCLSSSRSGDPCGKTSSSASRSHSRLPGGCRFRRIN